MIQPKTSVWGAALRLFSVGFVLKQVGLGVVVFATCIVWLRLPDASAIEVVASMLLALLIVSIAGVGESAIILEICDVGRTRRRLILGAVILLTALALCFGWSSWIEHLSGSNDQLAGYLNSRFPHGLRPLFSYAHIVLWLGWLETLATWIGIGVLALGAFAFAASMRPVPVIFCAFRSLSFWLVVVVGGTGASLLTGSILQWVPGQTLRVEMVSLVVRLLAVVAIDTAVVCMFLLIVAACVRQSGAAYAAVAGTPVDSQERTVDMP